MTTGDPLSDIEVQLAVLARTLEGMSRRSQIHRELDRSSYLLARTLASDGPASINGLAARLGLDATTVTRQVATMERSGLVSRHAHPSDGRVSVIELAPPGRRRMDEVRAAREARIGELVADWPVPDRTAFADLLERFNQSLLEHPPAVGPPSVPAPRRRQARVG